MAKRAPKNEPKGKGMSFRTTPFVVQAFHEAVTREPLYDSQGRPLTVSGLLEMFVTAFVTADQAEREAIVAQLREKSPRWVAMLQKMKARGRTDRDDPPSGSPSDENDR